MEVFSMKKFIVIKISSIPLRISILLFPAVIIYCFYVLGVTDYDFYIWITDEDNLFETLTSVIYLISSIIAIWVSISFIKQKRTFFGISYAFLACGMFFISGEEISWGQRLLNISPPQYFLEHSVQREINLHNLQYIEDGLLHKSFILVGLYGSFFWMAFLKIKEYNLLINPYFIPEWYLMGYFLPVSLFYIYHDHFIDYNNFLGFTSQEQEPAEFILSMGFLLFISINRFRQIQEFNLSRSKLVSITST